MGEEMLVANKVDKTYQHWPMKGGKKALKDASFHLNLGEVCGLVGPNGAGKSTLIKCIIGLENFNGELKINIPDHSIIGFVPEKPTFFAELSGFYNLLYYARLMKLNEPEVTCTNLMTDFGLEDRKDDPVNEYSKGMKQRLAIARSLMSNPRLLLLDEPFSGLDPTMIVEVRETIVKLKESKITILLSSHDLNEVEELCDSVIFIKEGVTIKKIALKNETLTRAILKLTLLNTDEGVNGLFEDEKIELLESAAGTYTLNIEKDNIPDLLESIFRSGYRIQEARIVNKRIEEEYRKIFMEDSR